MGAQLAVHCKACLQESACLASMSPVVVMSLTMYTQQALSVPAAAETNVIK